MGAGADALRRAYLDQAEAARGAGDTGKAERLAKVAARLAAPAAGPEPIRKAVAAQPSAAELRERVAKLDRDIAATRARLDETRAEGRVDEVMALLAKSAGGRNREALAEAGVLLRGPSTEAAYCARVHGERYQAPVAKAAEPDRRAEIRKLLVAGDHAGLGELLRAGADYGQYLEVANEPLIRATVAEVRKAGGQGTGRGEG